MTELFPTKNRDPKPKGWGYPIGAEKLSELLSESDRPLDLFFYYRESIGLSHYAESSRSQLKRVDAYPSTYKYQKIMTLIWVGEKWGLSIFAVKSDKKNRIKAIIETTIMPKVVYWLKRDRVSTWFEGKHRLEVGVKDDLSKVCYWEVHNTEVVDAQFDDIATGQTNV